MRCVQMQEMPPNPTHWTFSGLLFCFFRYVSPPHRWQLLSGGIMFSGSLILVLFFSVGIKDGLCFCGHRSEVSWLRGLCSDAWCWTVMSHPSLSPLFYVSVCLCCIINILKKCTKKRSEVKVTTTSRLSHSCEWTNTKSVAVVAVFHHKLFSFTGVELQVIVVAPCVKALHQSCSYWNWFTGITHVDTVITFFFFM